MQSVKRDIEISEVGPRDGLQSIEQTMPTAAKKAWITAQAAAGTPEIEVGSFVSPKLLPQLADTAELVGHALAIPGLTVAALAPNLRGLANAAEAGVHKVSIPFSMSETHSLRNVKKTHEQMREEVRRCLDFLAELPAQRGEGSTFRECLQALIDEGEPFLRFGFSIE